MSEEELREHDEVLFELMKDKMIWKYGLTQHQYEMYKRKAMTAQQIRTELEEEFKP